MKWSKIMPIGYEAKKPDLVLGTMKTKRTIWIWLVSDRGDFLRSAPVLFENLSSQSISLYYSDQFIGLFLIFSLVWFYFDQGGYCRICDAGSLAVRCGGSLSSRIWINRDTGLYNRNVLKSVRKAIPILLTIYVHLALVWSHFFDWRAKWNLLVFTWPFGTIGGLIFSMVEYLGAGRCCCGKK